MRMSCVARCQWSGSFLAVCRFIDAIVEIFTANDIMQCTHLRGNPKARYEAMLFSDRTPGGRRQFVEDAFMQYALETGGGPDAGASVAQAPADDLETRSVCHVILPACCWLHFGLCRMQRAMTGFLEKRPAKVTVHVDLGKRMRDEGLAPFFPERLWPRFEAVNELARKLKTARDKGQPNVYVFVELKKCVAAVAMCAGVFRAAHAACRFLPSHSGEFWPVLEEETSEDVARRSKVCTGTRPSALAFCCLLFACQARRLDLLQWLLAWERYMLAAVAVQPPQMSMHAAQTHKARLVLHCNAGALGSTCVVGIRSLSSSSAAMRQQRVARRSLACCTMKSPGKSGVSLAGCACVRCLRTRKHWEDSAGRNGADFNIEACCM